MGRYALIVGIGEYRRLGSLSKPKSDAGAVCDLLRDRGNFDEVQLLQDAEATYAGLLERLEYVLLRQGDRAEVLLYFTGHGFTAGQSARSQQGYLATYDCEIKQDADGRILYAERALPFQELNELIKEATPAKLAMLLDCCHSEFFVEQALVGRGLSEFGDRDYFLSAACRSYEQAWADADAPHSVYTGALLQALRDETAEEVTASEAHNSVRRAIKGLGQEPTAFGYGDSLVLVAYRQAAATVSEVCPYQGLKAFTPETAEFFFGRDADVGRLLQKLKDSNFVPVLGPSGSGKSSVVRAGLVTKLLAQGWQVVTMKPGDEPLANLKAVLRELFVRREVSAGEQRRLMEVLEADGLLAIAQQLPEMPRVLLVVDQFEEVFTLCKKEMQQWFIDELIRVGQANSPLAVVMTMRSDFFDDWLRAGLSVEVLQNDAVILGSLKEEELAAAISEPARKQGYKLEPELLRSLLRDVEREENYLPLLEFALTELWEQRDEKTRKLTGTAYDEIGGLEGALERRATAAYNKLRETDRVWAKRIFLQLVRIGRGEKDTRQRQPKELLLSMGGTDNKQNEQTRRAIADVIADLVKGRLLVTDSGSGADLDSSEDEIDNAGYVDLAHEALLEGWELLTDWRLEDRVLRRLVQRIEDEYEAWQKVKTKKEKNKDEYLLKGGLLAEAREQREVLDRQMRESRPMLMQYFVDSDQKDSETVVMLQRALADANVRAEAARVRDNLLNNPAQTVDATLSAIALVGSSQQYFQSKVVSPAQDALHCAWLQIRERTKIEGHSHSVYSVAFSPDGERIISGSADCTLRLWDLEGNAIGKPFRGHSSSVYSVAFSPNGRCIVSGSDDNTLRLWDLKGNSLGRPFEGHSSMIYAVAFSPKGDRIVSGSVDKTLRLWDLEGNSIGSPFKGHDDVVYSVDFSPKGDCIVSGSVDKTLRLWDLEGNSIGTPFQGHSHWVRSVTFNPAGDLILSGSEDKTLRLWDLEGNSIGTPFEGHNSSVYSVAFNHSGSFVISGSDDKTLRLWDLEGNSIGTPFEGHSDSVYSVAFSPDGQCMISGGCDHVLRLWNLNNNAICNLFESRNSVHSVAFSPLGDCIAASSTDETLRLWSLDGSPIGDPFEGHSRFVCSVAFSPDGKYIVSGGADNTLRLWDLKGNPVGNPFEGHTKWVRSVAFSPDGRYIVSGSNDWTLRLWDLMGNHIGKPIMGHGNWVTSVAFCGNGNHFVSGSADSTLRLWNLEGIAISNLFEGHSDSVSSVAFSPKGDRIVLGNTDNTIQFKGHSGSVSSVAFSPKGDRIVSGSADNTIRLWDLEGNAIGEPFKGHSGSVSSVAFSPTGDRIISGSADSTIRLWDFEGNTIGNVFKGQGGSVNSIAFSPQGEHVISGGFAALRLWRISSWANELRYCCNMLMHHTALTLPQTEMARKACEVCEQVWTRQQSAEFLVAQGSALARKGEVDKAVAKFNRAQELDAELTFDSVKRANELAEWSKAPGV